MSEILNLAPEVVWRNFVAINAIPRPSKNEARIAAYMLSFGEKLQLETLQDKIGNVIIRKPATHGMENRQTVILQAHLDMVWQKNNDVAFDFDNQGIDMYVKDGFVKARGTTLGADNGLGVAAIMAVLESQDIAHPAIEALFTIDEETGMTGAKELQQEILKGSILLNLDTEDDRELTMGCAGGIDVTATQSYTTEKVAESAVGLSVTVKGLKGGHSGADIHLGLGNSNKMLARFLFEALAANVQIATMESGSLRNAIPREGNMVLALPGASLASVTEAFSTLKDAVMLEYKRAEPHLNISWEEVPRPVEAASASVTRQLAYSLMAAHNGVYRMSDEIEGLTETSNNIANVRVGSGEMSILCLTRSASESAKMALANSLRAAFELAGFTVSFSGAYPGWRPNADSKILGTLRSIYTELFNEAPLVMATHGGLECGIIGGRYPGLDMISFGPNISGAHSPDERAEIVSAQKFWKFLVTVLANIPEQN
jgi:dipeptidase D